MSITFELSNQANLYRLGKDEFDDIQSHWYWILPWWSWEGLENATSVTAALIPLWPWENLEQASRYMAEDGLQMKYEEPQFSREEWK